LPVVSRIARVNSMIARWPLIAHSGEAPVSSGILYETPAFGVSVRRPVTDPMRASWALSFANLREGRVGGGPRYQRLGSAWRGLGTNMAASITAKVSAGISVI
jgi:hypothetical protein